MSHSALGSSHAHDPDICNDLWHNFFGRQGWFDLGPLVLYIFKSCSGVSVCRLCHVRIKSAIPGPRLVWIISDYGPLAV